MRTSELVITSLRAIEEALENPRDIIRLVVTTDPLRPRVERIVAKAHAVGIRVVYVDPQRLRQYTKERSTQVVLLTAFRPIPSFEEIIARTADDRAFWVMLWKVTNVGNLGAIIRSAFALGARGVIWTQHGMPGFSNDLIHASAGTALKMNLAMTTSIPRAIEYARSGGIETWALDIKGEHSIDRIPVSQPHIWLAGAEDTGLPHHLLRQVDRIFRIPMHPQAESLNVAVSVALACYESSKHQYGISTA